MKDLVLRRDVSAPTEAVWNVVADLERSQQVVSAITSVERLDGGTDFGVGTRWKETRLMFGREATEVMKVTALDPGRSYVVEADSKGAHYRSTMSLEPIDAGTRLAWTFGAKPSGTLGRIVAATIGRLLEGTTRKALQKDLNEIAAAAEGGSA